MHSKWRSELDRSLITAFESRALGTAIDGLLGMGMLDRLRSVSIDAVRHRPILERG